MEDVRSLLRDMHDEEERLLVARQLVADRSYKWIAVVLALGIVGAILVLGSAGWMVAHDASRAARQRAVACGPPKTSPKPRTDPRASFSRT